MKAYEAIKADQAKLTTKLEAENAKLRRQLELARGALKALSCGMLFPKEYAANALEKLK